MGDRRAPPYHGYPTQWNGNGQQYPASPSYSSTSYQHGGHDVDLHRQPAYMGMDAPTNGTPYQENYHTTSPSFSQPNGTVAHQTIYPSTGQGMASMRDPHSPQRTGHYHSHSQSHSHGQSPYNHIPSQSQSHYAQTRPRSHSQTPSYIRTQPIPIAIPQHSPSHFPTQAISISPQYPATPSRPFTCDLCALSFNRQHDLKRHRETHTGEKPYLCNGGCGKTFTRKDALKRHQLVKACGKVDDAWP